MLVCLSNALVLIKIFVFYTGKVSELLNFVFSLHSVSINEAVCKGYLTEVHTKPEINLSCRVRIDIVFTFFIRKGHWKSTMFSVGFY